MILRINELNIPTPQFGAEIIVLVIYNDHLALNSHMILTWKHDAYKWGTERDKEFRIKLINKHKIKFI